MTVQAKLQPERQPFWPDERLVAECREGNQQAWAALLEKYKNLIYSIPIKLGLYQDAADIFQAVCLETLSGLDQLRAPRALAKWLIQTCYHKCLEHRRRSERYSAWTENARDELPKHGVVAPVPQELLLELEKEQMVRDAILQLSPRCERMIHMLFFETPPRSYQQIASDLELATGSIGFIRGRCLEKLRKELEKLGF
ncbi:MAG: RNA polymerase sigma factor [Acidobacteria bacterium]|nr:RNA polymerase sigma factor [Acidobacteriota bacterium]